MGKSSISTYICQNRHGTYYARLIIPKSFRDSFNNKREIRRSLQTDSRRLAIKRARAYRVQFEILLDEIMGTKNDISDRAKKIVDELFAPKKKVDHFGKSTAVKDKSGLTEEKDGEKLEFITIYHPETGRPIATVDYNNDESKEIPAAAAIVREVTNISSTVAAPLQPASKKLSEYLKEYIKFQTTPQPTGKKNKDGEPILKPLWHEDGAARQNPPKLDFFCSVVQDKLASTLTWEDIENYVELTHALPKNFNHEGHKTKFQGLTVDQILDDNIEKPDYKTRLPSAVRLEFSAVIAFLRWTQERKRIRSLLEPISSLALAIKDIKYESARRAFTPDELKTLFEQNNPATENYIKGFNSKRGIDASLKYWLPLLGLYTGATLAELCQLHLSDIYQHKAFDGSEQWVIDINDEGDRRLKNKFRARLIPIHKNLMELDFLNYIKYHNKKGNIKLFPSAKRIKGQFGAESQWWGEYSNNAGITDENVVFHSFRHSLCSSLGNLGATIAPEGLITAISGHTYKSLALTNYYRDGHRNADIGPLAMAINSIDYDLNHPNMD